MACRRKPLDDARKRLSEKLCAIDEQVVFIQNSVTHITSEVRQTAEHLLAQTNKTKFFAKYRGVSQELEKCLDDLLLISATISSLDDQDDEEDGDVEDDDDGEEDDESSTCVENSKGIEFNDKTTPSAKKQRFSEKNVGHPLSQNLESSASVPEIQKDTHIHVNTESKASQVKADQSRQPISSVIQSNVNVPQCQAVQANFVHQSPPPITKLQTTECYKSHTASYLNPSKDDVYPCELQATTEIDSTDELVSMLEVCQIKEEKEGEKVEEVTNKPQNSEQLKFGLSDVKNAIVINSEKHTEKSSNPLSPVQTWKENSKPIKSSSSPTEIFAGDVIEEALKSECCECNSGTQSPTKNDFLAIPPFKFPDDSSLEVAVTEVISPVEFWIQQINGDLDLLMEEMCIFFSKRAKTGDKGGMSDLPGVGEFCCGKCTQDDIWYRALVSAVNQENLSVDVLFVDEGNKESLPLSRLRPLDEKFYHLPCQALRCQLSGIQFKNDVNIDEVNDWFTRRVSGETLEAVLQDKDIKNAPGIPVPIQLYIRPHGTTTSSKIKHLKLEYNLNEMMIREGLSQRAPPPNTTCQSISPTSSSHSDGQSIERTDSILSTSTATSGFHDAPSPDLVEPANLHTDGNIDQRTTVTGNSGFHAYESRVLPPVISLDSDGSLCMLVSHVVNPGEFYVHILTTEARKLDTLMDDMNKVYAERNLRLDKTTYTEFSPQVGDFCCARFSDDGNWYRAVILQIRHVAKSTITVEVFYIDFGNIETVSAKDLDCLLPQFMELPMQVVRCSLADIQPMVCEEEVKKTALDFFAEAIVNEKNVPPCRRRSDPRRKSPRRAKGGHHLEPSPEHNLIHIAAGDEDEEADLLDPFIVIKESKSRVRSRSSISEDIERSNPRSALMSDTAVELFEKVWSGVARPNNASSWPVKATEYFQSLTKTASKLIGFVVTWDSKMLNDITNYSQVTECSLPNLGPVLNLNLYDINGDEDVFINGAMVKANLAVLSVMKQEGIHNSIDILVVKTNQQELTDIAETIKDHNLSCSPSDSTNSPASPTLNLLDAWNPMSNDYKSSRNAYNVETDNVDVAITGYEENRGKICRFYRSKYGCYQGNKCPYKHIQEDGTGKVCIFGGRSNAIVLPDIGAWVAVKITAVYNPGHFWLQMPFGKEPLDTQIIKSRSGKETTGEENVKDLDDLMKQIESYSKIIRRERSLAPVACGEFVLLKYGKDNQWYRGKVTDEKDNKYKASFVDYGFLDWVRREDVVPIIPQFLHLPFQAVECFLAHIKPKTDKENPFVSWSMQSQNYFKSLVEDKVLVCQVLSTGSNNTMLVNLYDTVDNQEVNINHAIIDAGFAEESRFKINQPDNCQKESCVLVELPG